MCSMTDTGLFATLMAWFTEAGEKGEICHEVIEAFDVAIGMVYQWGSDMFALNKNMEPIDDTDYQKTKRFVCENVSGMPINTGDVVRDYEKWYAYRGVLNVVFSHARARRSDRLRTANKVLRNGALKHHVQDEIAFAGFCNVYPPPVCEEPGEEQCSCPKNDKLIDNMKCYLKRELGVHAKSESDALLLWKEIVLEIDPHLGPNPKKMKLWDHMTRSEMLTGPWGIRIWGLHLPTYKSAKFLERKQKYKGEKKKIKDLDIVGPNIEALVATAKSLRQYSVMNGQVESLLGSQEPDWVESACL